MNQYHVKNIYEKCKEITVQVPGSKSITNRALHIAALAEGESILDEVLLSDDALVFVECLQRLGIDVTVNKADLTIKVKGTGGTLPVKECSINVGSAGTAARFLTVLLGTSEGNFYIDSSDQMKARPMKPLLDSLIKIGSKVTFHEKEGYFPFKIIGCNPKISNVEINIDKSSQFLSALLISSCLSKEGMNIEANGTHGMSYVKMTTAMMKDFGVTARNPSSGMFVVSPGQKYTGRYYHIEPDVSAACYFYAMAAILGVRATVKGVYLNSLQGDIQFVETLKQMGCTIEETKDGISVQGPIHGNINGVSVNMSSFSDQALTLAAIAPYADSPVTICGISHIRGQECDRINAIVCNLKSMGIKVTEHNDVITIYPGTPKPAEIQTFCDHRVAMAFAVTGLRADGIVINDPLCCKKTFAEFFDVLNNIISDQG